MPQALRCAVCAEPVKKNNKYLICNRTPACRKAYGEARRAAIPKGWRIYVAIGAAKKRARAKGWDFDLTPDNIPPIPAVCPVLGMPLVMWADGKEDHVPSIDRINGNEGYLHWNVRWTSWRANNLRGDGSAEELRLVAEDAARLEALSTTELPPPRKPRKPRKRPTEGQMPLWF